MRSDRLPTLYGNPQCDWCLTEIFGQIERDHAGREYHARCLPITKRRRARLDRINVEALASCIVARLGRHPCSP
jgi:hypothetical protein